MKKQLALLLSALLITSSGTGFAAWTGSPVSGVGGITASSATSVEVTVGDASNPRLEMTWNAFTCDSGQTVTFRQGAGASSYLAGVTRVHSWLLHSTLNMQPESRILSWPSTWRLPS